ncbi:MAG: protein-export chaperone SecB [Proteobacteria bacterium]|nr:protein-export chaperone SecB [Pseudomonadota bacterium]MBU1738951.1 protein-export chaperone SecB [Pseudomonadota bacterium]
MTEEKNEATSPENGPVFRMQKMFLKDLSFESPNAPKVFLEQNPNPKVDINLQVKNTKLDHDNWDVTLGITASLKGEGDKTIFIIEIEHAAVFLLKNIPQEHVQAVLSVDCPSLLFPFTRQIMSQVSVDGGFMPFLMDPVNFLALYENSRKQGKGEGKKQ